MFLLNAVSTNSGSTLHCKLGVVVGVVVGVGVGGRRWRSLRMGPGVRILHWHYKVGDPPLSTICNKIFLGFSSAVIQFNSTQFNTPQ